MEQHLKSHINWCLVNIDLISKSDFDIVLLS